MLNIRKILVINGIQRLHVRTSCKSSLGNEGGEGGKQTYGMCMGFPKSKVEWMADPHPGWL